jgi:hypothetical protein
VPRSSKIVLAVLFSLPSLSISIANISGHPADEEFGAVNMACGKETRETPKKLPGRAVEFPDSQTAIDDLLDDWLPSLIRSNEILTAALVRVKGICLAESSSVAADRVLAEVDVAFERAATIILD